MFVILELIKTGTRGRKKNHVARLRLLNRRLHRSLKRPGLQYREAIT